MEDKFEKNKNCGYCGRELNAKYRSKKYCSSKCRVYASRESSKVANENKIPALPVSIFDATKPTHQVKPTEQPKTNFSINTTIPPMPEKLPGENGIDYAARKNEWKRKYGQK